MMLLAHDWALARNATIIVDLVHQTAENARIAGIADPMGKSGCRFIYSTSGVSDIAPHAIGVLDLVAPGACKDQVR